MIKRTAILMAVAFMFVIFTGVVFADKQDRDRDRDRDRDGTCQAYTIETDHLLILAHKGHGAGDGGGPFGPGDCDPDGPWWDA